jgi:hypothetical protein
MAGRQYQPPRVIHVRMHMISWSALRAAWVQANHLLICGRRQGVKARSVPTRILFPCFGSCVRQLVTRG